MKVQPLNNRKLISLEGNDSFSFMQGMVTNDMEKARIGKTSYNLMLTPQGRFLYDFYIFMLSDGHLYIDHEAKYTEDIIKKLNMYKLKSYITIHNLTEEYDVIAVEDRDPYTVIGIKDPRFDKLGHRCYFRKEESSKIEGTKSKFYTETLYEYLIPEPHQDMIQEKSFPMEYGMDNFNAIDFDKGCYIGQELTARTKHRGVVRKKLYKLQADKAFSDIETGASISSDGHKIGIFCSAHGKVAKALLRIEESEKYIMDKGEVSLSIGDKGVYIVQVVPSKENTHTQ